MLALGRALARKPRLLILDELSLGLAPVIVERLLPVVSNFAAESGCAVLLVEQHIHIALAVANRGYVLSHGELVIHERAEVLRADHQLILSGYLGEQAHQVPRSEHRTSERRLKMASTTVPASHADLLDAPLATLATVGRDGLQANPVIGVHIQDAATPMRHLEVRGDASIEPDDDYAFADRVGAKYGGVDLRVMDAGRPARVVVTVQPTRVNAVNLGA